MLNTSNPTLGSHLRAHARVLAAAFLAVLVCVAGSVAVGAIGLDTAAGVLLGAILGGVAAAAVATRSLRGGPPARGRRAEARRHAEDTATLDRLEPLEPERS